MFNLYTAPVFESNKMWEEFKSSLMTWEGTPYRHLQKTKGCGADCTLFITEVMAEIGVMKGVPAIQYYPKNWFSHERSNRVLYMFKEAFERFTNQPFEWKQHEKEEKPMRGDVMLFCLRPRTGVIHHSGVYLGDSMMFHGTTSNVFKPDVFTDKWEKFRTGLFRVYRSGEK